MQNLKNNFRFSSKSIVTLFITVTICIAGYMSFLAYAPIRAAALPSLEKNLSQTQNGIKLDLRSVRRLGNTVTFNICYPISKANDGGLDDVKLWINGEVIDAYERGLDEFVFANGQEFKSGDVNSADGSGRLNKLMTVGFTARCDNLSFNIAPATLANQATLSIGAISDRLPDGISCNDILARFGKHGMADKVDCAKEEQNHDRWQPKAEAKQAGVDADKLYKALIDSKPGPWVFATSLN